MDTDFQLTRRADLKQPDGVVHGGDQKRVGLNGIAQPDRGRKDVPNDADPAFKFGQIKNIGGGTIGLGNLLQHCRVHPRLPPFFSR